MTCAEAKNLLSEYVDGELASNRRQDVDSHLAGCEECRREKAGLVAVRRALQALPVAHAPVGFVDRVAAQALTGTEHSSPSLGEAWSGWWRRVQYGLSALAVAGAAAALFVVTRSAQIDSVKELEVAADAQQADLRPESGGEPEALAPASPSESLTKSEVKEVKKNAEQVPAGRVTSKERRFSEAPLPARPAPDAVAGGRAAEKADVTEREFVARDAPSDNARADEPADELADEVDAIDAPAGAGMGSAPSALGSVARNEAPVAAPAPAAPPSPKSALPKKAPDQRSRSSESYAAPEAASAEVGEEDSDDAGGDDAGVVVAEYSILTTSRTAARDVTRIARDLGGRELRWTSAAPPDLSPAHPQVSLEVVIPSRNLVDFRARVARLGLERDVHFDDVDPADAAPITLLITLVYQER